jgi:hypothetical protein
MRYTVTWRASKQQKLARIWLASTDRRAVSAAADQIDLILAADPELVAQDFYGDCIMTIPPLVVVYTISHDDRLVEVIEVYHQGRLGE